MGILTRYRRDAARVYDVEWRWRHHRHGLRASRENFDVEAAKMPAPFAVRYIYRYAADFQRLAPREMIIRLRRRSPFGRLGHDDVLRRGVSGRLRRRILNAGLSCRQCRLGCHIGEVGHYDASRLRLRHRAATITHLLILTGSAHTAITPPA